MPSELEELVEFIHHGNAQIRQTAVEHLVGYSKTQRSIFKTGQLTPVKDLKMLVKDYAPISKNALIMLINLSDDLEILKNLSTDDPFLESLLLQITNPQEPNANEIAMLLANLAKSDDTFRVLNLQRAPVESLSTSKFAIDQLMDCFVKGAEGKYNKSADFDYLSYFFADFAKDTKCRSYLSTPQDRDDGIVPLTKLAVFTEHASIIRRRGVASTIKNAAFNIDAHERLMASSGPDAVNILPYILLPLMGSEEYSDEDMEGMLDDLQLLPPDKERERDIEILKTHVETLLLLTTTREGRDLMRSIKVYPIIRETHLHVEDEEAREVCDRLVQVLMRDEEGEEDAVNGEPKVPEVEVDEDEQITDVF